MIYLEDGTVAPVDKVTPIELPDDIDLSAGNPLSHPNWKMTTQKSTGKKATKETDTLILCRFVLVFYEILFSKIQGWSF